MYMDIKVFKFGGASVKDVEGILNVTKILNNFKNEKIVVVVSAMGKTTLALEKVVDAYFHHTGEEVRFLEGIKEWHYEHIKNLSLPTESTLIQEINDLFVEVEWVIEEELSDPYDYLYDQIVSIGELVSTKIVYHAIKSVNASVEWLDARDCIITDNNYRDARVDWKITEDRIDKNVGKIFERGNLIVTQGFIGSSTENFTTTLAKEGSDFTAAIFSFCLGAKSMHIWKDVPGILTADPKLFPNAKRIDKLSYREAIEMTYFGAKVIHPKTIKPIENKSIPLYVRPFTNPEDEGTCISNDGLESYPPIVIIENNQALLLIRTNDFSFVAEHHLSDIFQKLAELRIKVNVMKNSAVSFTICITNLPHKVQTFIEFFRNKLTIEIKQDLELITVRNYNAETVNELTKNRKIIFEEFNQNTRQMVVQAS